MRKYLTVLGLSCVLIILINASGCRFFASTKKCTLFSDSDHTVSAVSGSGESSIGIVIDNREFLLCDYTGSELNRMRYETDIVSLDVIDDCVLLAFEDNILEAFQITETGTDSFSSYKFDYPIKHAEFTDHEHSEKPICTVLLSNGDLWRNEETNLSHYYQVDNDVISFAYDTYSDLILYNTQIGELRYLSFWEHDYSIDEDIICLNDIIEVKEASIDSYNEADIRFLVTTKDGDYFVQISSDYSTFSLYDKNPKNVNILGVSKSIPKGMVYSADGKLYYEGPSYNDRNYYGVRYSDHINIHIPKGYDIHVIQGGVVYYNDHEVKLLLIK